MKDAAPGEDETRLRYIRAAGDEIRKSENRKIQWLWENPPYRWNDEQKVGITIPLHKKGDKKDINNFRGICLLPIMSRILARILATRLRNWTEATGALDENQAGLRQGRSTAGETQIFVRIQDVKVIRNMEEINNEREERKEMASLIDLKKAYLRVIRPILLAILENHRLPNKVIDKRKDLHEFTSYRVRGVGERDSTKFIPQRGLPEGCAMSPVIF